LPPPSSVLHDPAANVEYVLGTTVGAPFSAIFGRSIETFGVQLADVTGDGVLDVFVGPKRADVGEIEDVGEILLWSARGGHATGQVTRLTVPGAQLGR
jgi:hypothetical protein